MISLQIMFLNKVHREQKVWLCYFNGFLWGFCFTHVHEWTEIDLNQFWRASNMTLSSPPWTEMFSEMELNEVLMWCMIRHARLDVIYAACIVFFLNLRSFAQNGVWLILCERSFENPEVVLGISGRYEKAGVRFISHELGATKPICQRWLLLPTFLHLHLFI